MPVFNAVYGPYNFCVLICRCCGAPIKMLKLSNSNNIIIIYYYIINNNVIFVAAYHGHWRRTAEVRWQPRPIRSAASLFSPGIIPSPTERRRSLSRRELPFHFVYVLVSDRFLFQLSVEAIVVKVQWDARERRSPPLIYGSKHSPTSDCYTDWKRHTTVSWWTWGRLYR